MDSITVLRDHIAALSESDRAFAESLLEQAHRRGLSAKQLGWIDLLASRATQPKAQPTIFAGIVAFMDNAAVLVSRPALKLQAGEIEIRLSIAGPKSRTPGLINVTSAHHAYEDRIFYGRIGLDGVFQPSLKPEPATQTAIVRCLQAMDADPAAAAAAYGKLTGQCSFCALPLSNIQSLAVGYGRICARKYGLPYGDA